MENTRRGVDLHEILAHIVSVEPGDDIGDIFERAFREASRFIDLCRENHDEYRSVITQMLSNPKTSRWFDSENRINTELPYWINNESNCTDREVSGRIDRLVELPDGTLEIVDYKFTRTQKIEYNEKLRDYMAAIKKIIPGHPVRGYLWYVDLGCIDEVEFIP